MTRDGSGEPLLAVSGLSVRYRASGTHFNAVEDVSFDIAPGEVLGLVGESGSGKSTIARAALRLEKASEGQISFAGQDLATLPERAVRLLRSRMQMIFQDPKASLNPRRRIKDIIAEPLLIWSRTDRGSIDARVADLMRQVGLNADVAARRPSELSGGQCQRVGIARALANGPQLLVGDEPVSALDVSVQAQILNLLRRTGRDNGLSMLFISHDLGVVKNLADRVMVLYLGRVCEIGSAAEIFDRPLHPYTRLLMASSRPGAETADMAVSTETPSPLAPPSGCRFRTRCPFAEEKCATTTPELRQLGPDHQVACHFADRWQDPSSQLVGSAATARALTTEVPHDEGDDHE